MVLRLIRSEIWKCANPKNAWKLKMWNKDEQINSFCLSIQPLTNSMECLTHIPVPPHHYSAPALWHLWPDLDLRIRLSQDLCHYLQAQRAGKENNLTSFLVQRAFCMVPESLFDSLTIAVSLSLAGTGACAIACGGRSLVSGTACAAALLKTRAGLSPLQWALCQKHGLKHRKIVTPTALLRSQQHAVCLVSGFLRRREGGRTL